MSYRNLEIWQMARELSIEIHAMSLELPKFEQYETGSQIRRSSKSVRSNIVEGYGRRMYKADYIRFLICALASNDETMDHLETLWETQSPLTKPCMMNCTRKSISWVKSSTGLFPASSQNTSPQSNPSPQHPASTPASTPQHLP